MSLDCGVPSDVYLRPFPKTNWLFRSFVVVMGMSETFYLFHLEKLAELHLYKSELKQHCMVMD